MSPGNAPGLSESDVKASGEESIDHGFQCPRRSDRLSTPSLASSSLQSCSSQSRSSTTDCRSDSGSHSSGMSAYSGPSDIETAERRLLAKRLEVLVKMRKERVQQKREAARRETALAALPRILQL
eukprot:TRINITY_DN15475_c0_g1_i1.p1 TRINITY_DN15475_c0_g1~~TRINITY_DN15475_c0_g1_i1.p1  ORF type:complete len:125 (-),score=11.53 TRINITY_DN15475_c0_g1_i1:260-634(-)